MTELNEKSAQSPASAAASHATAGTAAPAPAASPAPAPAASLGQGRTSAPSAAATTAAPTAAGTRKPSFVSAGAVPPAEAVAAVAGNTGPLPIMAPNPALFVSRELSWLEFNRRVLLEAAERSTPLLKRLEFESIWFSNLDEFFMVRIGTLSDQARAMPGKFDEKTGMTASEQIAASIAKVRSLQSIAQTCWRDLRTELSSAGIDFVDPEHASEQEAALVARRFKESIRIQLAPLVIDRHHPFPFLRNKEQYVISLLEGKSGKPVLGIVPVSRLPDYSVFEIDGRKKIIFTADIVRRFSGKIFNELKVRETAICRITRNADIPVDESLVDDSGSGPDFRGVMQELLKKRKRLAVVRVQFQQEPSNELRTAICTPLEVSENECFTENMPLDFSFGFSLASKLGNAARGLTSTALPPGVPYEFNGNAAATIRNRDILLAYPFHSMKPFIRLLEEAADDPDVLSIRITLYRISSHSKIAVALARAAENGKDVLCVLELRARFDEQNNIDYAETLEHAGCTVIYGLPDFKVHAKVCLITYRTRAGTQTITQIGTGNYNEKTASLYTDLCYITADPATGRDAAKIFNAIGTGSIPRNPETLWVAPTAFLPNVLDQINEEIVAAQSGEANTGIAIKVNGMNNLAVMRKLAEASQAGVKIELFVRGICCLRPGIPGLTENISVRSVVGTYLEHSRIFVFGKGSRERVFIGSGDLMNRNLVRRVEVFTQVRDPELRNEVLHILDIIRRDNLKAWEMLPDGSYRKPPTASAGKEPCDSQLALYAYFNDESKIPHNTRRRTAGTPGSAAAAPAAAAAAPNTAAATPDTQHGGGVRKFLIRCLLKLLGE